MSQNIGKNFIEKTKYEHLGKSDQQLGRDQPPLEQEYSNNMQIIVLPDPEKLNIQEMNLKKAIEARRSVRRYSDTPLSLEELSWLLWSTQGVKEKSKNYTLRTVPSAGARHAFETYILVNNVENLESGLYRFAASEHKLVEYNLERNISDKIAKGAYGQDMVKKNNVTFIWVAVPYRMNWRYQERGYRYLFLDAGHVCQNLYLAALNIETGVCAVGAFNDDELNQLLNLDGENEFVIYLASVGKK